MSLSALLNVWQTDPAVAPNIVDWRVTPALPPRLIPFPDDIHPDLADALRAGGIRALYSHQALAWQLVQGGSHPVIVTGTASGKSLCYNLPVLDRLLRDPDSRALYLFPTKALAQDQKDDLQQMVAHLASGERQIGQAIPVATYDGDTPSDARSTIRRRARLVISNPDMLHAGILPHHTAWADFFRHLDFVVLDEMHTYRGVFGSHVANLIRRLKRVARFYGAAPQFILTSATIGNPLEFAAALIEEPVVLVDHDGAPKAARQFLIYNPPVVDQELGLRRSLLLETVRLAQDLLQRNVQTIIFGRTRRAVELMLTYLQPPCENRGLPQAGHRTSEVSPPSEVPGDTGQDRAPAPVRGYRSGYLPRQRRQIERGLRQGKVRAVVATSALELGIDIGGMDAAVLAGYPGTIAQTWQQAGRAGRKDRESLALLIASASPLDQFLARHPDYFFGRSPEQALINPDHLVILLKHVRCAAFELPFQIGECFGLVEAGHLQEYLDVLQETGEIHRSGQKYFWMADRYPAQDISLRSASPEAVVLQSRQSDDEDAPVIVGQVDRASAPWMVHPHAVYLHEGQTYLVEELDLEQNLAQLKRVETDFYTEPRTETTVHLAQLAAAREAPACGVLKGHGDLLVTSQVVGFRRIQWYTHQRLDEGDVNLPPAELATTGYWMTLNDETVDSLRAQGAWSNDPNAYGPTWAQQRQLVRERDGFRCQVCRAPERGRPHDVHHKVPFRAFASPQKANQVSNLVTLCQTCHQRAEVTVRVCSGLVGLAFALRQLAPLSLMCDVHDLGVHSDPQLAFAGGRPGVVIYDQAPGGIGFSQRLFELHDEIMGRACDLVSSCECADGCPSCVGPGGEQGTGGKRETLAILRLLTRRPAVVPCASPLSSQGDTRLGDKGADR